MKKTDRIVAVELLAMDIRRKGFDRLWDEVRIIYPADEYEILNAKEVSEGNLILVNLRKIEP